jgi:hypothetical protein
MVIIAIAAAVIIYKKKVDKKKNNKQIKEDELPGLVIEQTEHANPLIQAAIPAQAIADMRMNVKRLSPTKKGTVFNIEDSELKAKQVFTPMAANGKVVRHVQQLSIDKNIAQAIPLSIYKGQLDRSSLKRNKVVAKVPENRVGFTPIKKEIKPQMARYEVIKQDV